MLFLQAGAEHVCRIQSRIALRFRSVASLLPVVLGGRRFETSIALTKAGAGTPISVSQFGLPTRVVLFVRIASFE